MHNYSIMNNMSEMMNMLNNPEMMKSMSEMMTNPEIQKMLSNPDFMKNAMNMMGNMNSMNPNNLNQNVNNNDSGSESESDNNNQIELEDRLFYDNQKIKIINLKNDDYNQKNAIITSYDSVKKRYNVYIEEVDKSISIKEENCENI